MNKKKKYQFELVATYYEAESFEIEASSREEAEEILHTKTRDKWTDATRVEFMLEMVDGSYENEEVDDCFRDYYDQ